MARSDFGRLLAAIREERGLTQDQLGARLGVSGTTVGGYETGEHSPRDRTLERIARRITAIDVVPPPAEEWPEPHCDPTPEPDVEHTKVVSFGWGFLVGGAFVAGMVSLFVMV